ncbi:MAG: carboxy terminal-processing peptidase [Pirellulales bacterium]|nr:carboxy terminal-processing peptidase [Pirellulales bacterium]
MTFLQNQRTAVLSAILCSFLTLGILTPGVKADVDPPSGRDKIITNIVTYFIGRQHMTKHEIDDVISARTFDSYMETLDPMKVYFTQDDIDEFRKQRLEIDDLLKRGDVNFAVDVFNRFLKRVGERVAIIEDLLDDEIDFTIDEEMISDKDVTSHPKTEDEIRERWRKRIKYDFLMQTVVEKQSMEEARKKLTKRYTGYLRRMNQLNNDDVLEMYLTAFTTSFDPHTTYMSPPSKANFDISLTLQLEGIGASLSNVDGDCVIARIVPGGAADKDGRLKTQDKIIGVAQGLEDEEFVDTYDMKLDDVVKMIRGKSGTVVRLKVLTEGEAEAKVIDITRARVELKDEEAKAEVFKIERPNNQAAKIGVIDLPSFYMDMTGARLGKPDYKSCTRDVIAILDSFKEQGVDAVVMDLRRNGGGSLTEAISLTGLFIDRGPVVQVKDIGGNVTAYDDTERGMAWEGPLVVLTSKLSASASEIFAGAIQDYGRGVIVGDPTTHGKGTVQNLFDLQRELLQQNNGPKLGGLKLTISQFYRPSGDSTQLRGVVSDIALPSVISQMDIGEGDLDYAMKFDHVGKENFASVGAVNTEIIKSLTAQSLRRLETSEQFGAVKKQIERYVDRKSRTTVPLNKEKFIALREDGQEDSEILEEIVGEPTEVIERDYYLNEALDITADYVRLLSGTPISRK